MAAIIHRFFIGRFLIQKKLYSHSFNFLLDIDAHRPSDILGNGLSADKYDRQIHPIKEITA